jgi:acyl dehydratase
MTGNALYWEDFAIGMTAEATGAPITQASIIDFAQQYDPQFFHVDPVRAKHSIYGRLIASGWHTGSIAMRLIYDAYLARAGEASLGSPGIDKLRWHKPVFVGDTLRMKMTVKERRASVSKPDRGSVLHLWEVFNQHGELVCSMEGFGMFKRRSPGAAA